MNSSKNHCFYKYTRIQNNCFQLHFCDSNSRSVSSSMLHLGSWGEFRFSPESNGRLSQKPTYYLWFILKGSFTFVRNDTTFKLVPGDIAVLRPGDVLSHFRLNAGTEGAARFLRIMPGLQISAFMENVPFTLNDIYHPGNFKEIVSILDSLDQIVEKGISAGSSVYEIRRQLSCRGYEIFTLILQGLHGDESDKLGEIIDYMLSNMNANLTLNEIEKKFHIERHSLTRLVHRYSRISPIKLLRSLRLEYSSRLLKSTKSAIAEVAAVCGFSSVSVYSRLFRKYYGLSPRTYREKFTPQDQSRQRYINHLGSHSKTERQEKIFHLINLNTKITREELAHEVGISLSGVDWNIRILKQRGLLNRFGSPRNGKWHPVTEYRM